MEVVLKYNKPTIYDYAPYGQIWVAELEDRRRKYIQLSKDEKMPRWSKLGEFLEEHITPEHLEEYLKRHAE